jgi:very-short-patch-repair endonuclease
MTTCLVKNSRKIGNMHKGQDQHNSPILKPVRKKLRKNLTPAEARMWSYLKSAQFNGLKFRRQHSIGPYIVDFYCPALRLALELDGE